VSLSENDYGPVFGELLQVDRFRALDAGSPEQAYYDQLLSLAVDAAFAHVRVANTSYAKCCLSAIWLLYDFLDESHSISQNITTAEGSFWHGIMHRREGDFSNAKYWFRKVGSCHPVYELLAVEPECGSNEWDPDAFVDHCQAALRKGGIEVDRCQRLQQREWELLFDHCYREAVGG